MAKNRETPTGLNYNTKGELQFGNVALKKVLQTHKTPFFAYHVKTLTQNYQAFYQAALKAHLPSPLVCFALKANANLSLLKHLAKSGSGADIVSGGELERALAAGIHPQKIVFSGVGKTSAEIRKALKCHPKGIFSFNVESAEELELIAFEAKKNKVKARVAFRLNPRVEAKTHKFISTGNKSHKFGILKNDILELSKTHAPHWQHCQLVGLSVHIGSQLLELSATEEAIHIMANIALELEHPLEFLDVGGGLGVPYHPDQKVSAPSLEAYMSAVSRGLHPYLTQRTLMKSHSKSTPLRVLFEPGRRLVAQAGCFVMSVLRNKTSEDQHFMIVDGGMNDFVRPSLYEAYHELLPLQKNASQIEHPIPQHVVGPICETSDCFAQNRPLPKLKAGDILVIADTGAYGYSMGSEYNLRKRPKEILI
jgi:diaminopimelate decarboxylase